MMTAAQAQNGSQTLLRNAGDIIGAYINESGLIAQKEAAVEIIDLKKLGLKGSVLGGLPELRPDQRIVFSGEGYYAAVMTMAPSGDYYEIPEFSIVNVKVSGSEGREIWKDYRDLTVSGVPGLTDIIVSDRGNFIGIKRNINIAENSELLFYNRKGELSSTVHFPAVTQVKFNSDGKIAGAISGSRGLVLFTGEGGEIVELGACQWFDLTYEAVGGDIPGAPIAVKCTYTNGSSIGLYSQENPKIQWEKSFGEEVFRDVSVSWYNGDILAVSKHNLYHINGATGLVIWERHLDAPHAFTTCALNKSSANYYNLAYGWESDAGRNVDYSQRHIKGGFSLIKKHNEASLTEYNEDLNYSNWNVFTPEVKFWREGLLIQTMDEIRYLKLNQGR